MLRKLESVLFFLKFRNHPTLDFFLSAGDAQSNFYASRHNAVRSKYFFTPNIPPHNDKQKTKTKQTFFTASLRRLFSVRFLPIGDHPNMAPLPPTFDMPASCCAVYLYFVVTRVAKFLIVFVFVFDEIRRIIQNSNPFTHVLLST